MSREWVNLISSVIIVCCSLWAGFCYLLYQRAYLSRVTRSKEIGNPSGVVIPSEISALISRFDPSVEIRIANDTSSVPQAATFYNHQKYIVMSINALQTAKSNSERLEEKHLLALVAHELGHTQLTDKSTWLLGLCISGVFGALMFLLRNLCPFNWTSILFSLLALCIFYLGLNTASWIEEFDADAFAVTHAMIPIPDLAEALTTLENQVNQRSTMFKRRLRRIRGSLGILCNTHPSIEHRIRRLKAHYNKE